MMLVVMLSAAAMPHMPSGIAQLDDAGEIVYPTSAPSASLPIVAAHGMGDSCFK